LGFRRYDMNHNVTIEADYNTILLTETDPDTGTITQEYFIPIESLNNILALLNDAQLTAKVQKVREALGKE